MKSLLITLSLVCLIAAPGEMAAAPPGEADLIGLYVDEDGAFNCAFTQGSNELVQAYLVFKNLTSASIGGWECKITFDGGGFLSGALPRGQAFNVGTRADEYIVGLGTPLVPTDLGGGYNILVVMDLYLFVTDNSIPLIGEISEIYAHSLPEAVPAYLDGQDVQLIVPMAYADALPHFTLNGDCTGPVPNETSSWGNVKSLYR